MAQDFPCYQDSGNPNTNIQHVKNIENISLARTTSTNLSFISSSVSAFILHA